MEFIIIFWITFGSFILALLILLFQTLKSFIVKYKKEKVVSTKEFIEIDTELKDLKNSKHSPEPVAEIWNSNVKISTNVILVCQVQSE